LLPDPLPPEIAERLIAIDQEPIQRTDAATRKMHAGILALLAGVQTDSAANYLRKVWQTDETRRNDAALALAQRPDGDNWAYLVSSISGLDKETAGDVLMKLKEVNRRPRDGKYYRELIQLGLRIKDSGADAAVALLEHWTGQKLTNGDSDWRSALQAWKQWYEKEFPTEQPISEPNQTQTNHRWTVPELAAALASAESTPDLSRGQRLFATAQCAKCHRHGPVGESLGPDLTSLAGRFSRIDMIDAMINPSKNVPDSYRGKKLTLTNGETLHGLVSAGPHNSWIVLKSDGERTRVAGDEVEEMGDLQQSTMPDGLLDKLTASEVADLIHYLESQPTLHVAGASAEPNPTR
jgi:putative heme-binding domain-containing protein